MCSNHESVADLPMSDNRPMQTVGIRRQVFGEQVARKREWIGRVPGPQHNYIETFQALVLDWFGWAAYLGLRPGLVYCGPLALGSEGAGLTLAPKGAVLERA